jgi:hypothetical protein
MTLMSVTTASLRQPARGRLRDLFAGVARNALRWSLLGIGGFMVVLGFLMAPLPGPLGLPVTLAGLVIVLRNSFAARRAFIKFQRKHPKTIFPLRRLLRREPEVVPVAWQQALRIERMILPKAWRKGAELRRKYFRR